MINFYKELRGFKTVETAGNFGLAGRSRLIYVRRIARKAQPRAP
jgi:hypothetical protein